MIVWRTVTAVILLALWLPALSHCQLERLPGLYFLECCCGQQAPAPARDCQNAPCNQIEAGFLKNNHEILLDRLVARQTGAPGLIDLESAEAAHPALPMVWLAPAELWAGWQFLCRAARLPRAPSTIS